MSNMKYRALLAVIEEGNLTAAAKKLSYSQPGISHMIDSLERELGFPLLIRLKTGVLPTEEANELLFHVRQLINSEDRILEISDKIKGVETGQVRIGTYFSVSVHWLPKVIREFESKHPDISIRLTEGDAEEVLAGIKDGIHDIGFISGPVPEGIDFIPIKQDPIMAVLPKDHPLKDKDYISMSDFEGYPFIYPAENSYEDYYKIIEADSVKFNVKYRVTGDEAILAMAAEGLGFSLMPQLHLSRNYENKLLIKPVNKKYSRTLGIALRSKKYASPAVKSFIQTALKILK